MAKDPNGQAIPVTAGNEIIALYKDTINPDARDTIEEALKDKKKESKAFFKGIKLKNAFVFDGKLIKRFFENGQDAELIIVCLGGHLKDETIEGVSKERGEPTVVVAGCKKVGDKFVTLKIDKPVSEHPPKTLVAKLEEGVDEAEDRLIFSFA